MVSYNLGLSGVFPCDLLFDFGKDVMEVALSFSVRPIRMYLVALWLTPGFVNPKYLVIVMIAKFLHCKLLFSIVINKGFVEG